MTVEDRLRPKMKALLEEGGLQVILSSLVWSLEKIVIERNLQNDVITQMMIKMLHGILDVYKMRNL